MKASARYDIFCHTLQHPLKQPKWVFLKENSIHIHGRKVKYHNGLPSRLSSGKSNDNTFSQKLQNVLYQGSFCPDMSTIEFCAKLGPLSF